MAALRRIGSLVVAVLVVGGVVPAFLPRAYHVERSVTVDATPERLHRLVGDLTAWDRWAPWGAADPTIETVVRRATGVGAHQTWTGESGEGRLTVTASDPAVGIDYDLSFDRGRFTGSGAIRYRPGREGTTVTWTLDGVADGWFDRYFAALMDRMVGPMFDDGLARLAREAATQVSPTAARGPSG